MKQKNLFTVILGCLTLLPLYAQYQLTPECYVDIEPNRYIVHFSLPDYWLEEEDGNDYEEGNGECEGEDDCGSFSEIVFGDEVEYDVTDVAGYPELPFFSLNLLLPECTSNVSVQIESSSIKQDYPPFYISPAAKGSWINEQGIYTELDDECFNSEYYYNGYSNDYPNGFYQDYYATSSIYRISNSTGMTFSIYPFAYYPELGYMDVMRDAVFIIEFDCGDLFSTIDEVQSSSGYNSIVAQLYFDTFNEMEITSPTGTNGRYLIVAAHRDMEANLMPYVSYKQLQNYDIGVIYLDDYGVVGNPYAIEYLIHVNDVLPNPDYVLLVGSLEDIPPRFGLNDEDIPYTDDPYHLFLGRWIVKKTQGEYADLANVINKTIQTETGYVNTYSQAALFSGTDAKKRVSKKFYRNIKQLSNKSFSPMGIPYTLYDGRQYSYLQAQAYMINELQSNPRFVVYRGHGYQNVYLSGIASPYWIGSQDISILGNVAPLPMGFGFACSLNAYNTDDNFGARWTVSKTNGGVAFYGATTPSYRSSNNYLAKRMFARLRKITNRIANFPLSLWLKLGEYDYYFALPTWQRGIQIDKYNLIGDPTLYVYGMNTSGSPAPFHMPKRDMFEDNTSCDVVGESVILSIDVFGISGEKIISVNKSSDVGSLRLQSGVYVVKTTYVDGTFLIDKIIK